MKYFMLFLCTAISLSIANGQEKADYQTAPNGVRYKMIVSNPEGKVVQPQDIITFTLAIYVNDSLLQENTQPVPMQVLAPQTQGDFFEAILMMHEGETASFAFDAKTFVGNDLPPFIKEEDMIYVTVGLVTVQTLEEFEKMQLQIADQRIQEEKSILQNYMKENQLQGKEMENGMFIVVLQEGQGNVPEKGNTVSVHYSGKLLNGTEFDNSFKRGAPIQFQVGMGQVIRGWDEGLLTMKKGGKAIFLIPSPLAYGDRDLGEIPPNSSLIFEVELIDIQ